MGAARDPAGRHGATFCEDAPDLVHRVGERPVPVRDGDLHVLETPIPGFDGLLST